MNKVKIIGVGEYLPGEQITNEKMEEIFGLKAEWIELVLGNEARHFAINLDENKVEHTLVDMCVEAANRAIKHSKIDKDSIDLLILSTATSDQLMPASVNVIAEKIEMDHVTTFQIQSGCAGCIQAFQLANTMLREGSYTNALIISADTTYKFMDLDRDFSATPPDELINFALFGDGAGASVLSIDESRKGLELVHIVNRLEGLNEEPGHILNWSATNGNKTVNGGVDEQVASEDYKAIERKVPVMTAELIDELLDIGAKTKDEIDFYLPPQLAGKMTDHIITECGLNQSKCINRVRKVGNTGNSTPYFQLVKLWDMMKEGDDVVLVAIESSKWIKTGMLLNFN